MYESFYGLAERPFDLTSNPRYLFLTSTHREALGNLTYGITSQKGVVLMLGEAGTGKTTIIRAAIEQHRGPATTLVHLSNPTLTRQEFFEFVAGGFGLLAESLTSKVRLLTDLSARLDRRLQMGGNCALIVDEAQSLPHEMLEEIRLLSNLENAQSKLLTVVLAGQPELAERLNDAALRQLKQRVALRCQLRPLDLRETAAYVAKRLRVAGGDSATVFTRESVVEIYRHSRGIPRTISVICDNALVNGFALDQRPIGAGVVLDVCRDFDFADQATVQPAEVSSPTELVVRGGDSATPAAGPSKPPAPADADLAAHRAHVIRHPRAVRAGSLLGLSQPDTADAQAVNAPPRRKRFLFF
jgi:type II secretory pathway predicted ATPase ExeA